jgi:hypothetical protein
MANDDLVERLKATRLGRTDFGGVLAGAVHEMLVNPDGLEAATRITTLEAELNTERAMKIGWQLECEEGREELAKLRADNAALVEGLEYYSGMHEPGLSCPNEGPWGVSSDDFGDRARAILAQHGGKNDG